MVLDVVSFIQNHPQPLRFQQRSLLYRAALILECPVRGDDDVTILQLGPGLGLGLAVVDPELDADTLVQVAVQLLRPVADEAGGADQQGRPPPASLLRRLPGRDDHLEAGLLVHAGPNI